MSTEFPNDFKETVRAQTDIVNLISEYVTLTPKRGGREYEGICPFHDDHKPSMNVSTERQTYKCWACQEGGDCFSFLMKIDSLEFVEALDKLADRANLERPKTMGRFSPEKKNQKASLIEVVRWAENEFHQFLMDSPQAEAARRYLYEDRGFTDETILQFRMGYHPGGWDWLIGRAQNKFSPKQLFEARLARQRNEGEGYYDDFRQRVMFPIRNDKGDPVAFGGRILPGLANEGQPKYLNSADSEIFSKSELLYGFHVAKEAIRKSEVAVVVEGYTDAITLHQYGICNVVGTLGVALTEPHVKLLRRFARKKMVLVYDGDDAGRNATERSISQFLSHDVDLRILILPEGQDPAEYIEENGPESLQNLLDNAPEALEYKYQICRERNSDTLHGREKSLDEMLDLIRLSSNIKGTLKEDLILNRLSQRLSVNESVLRQKLVEKRQELGHQRIQQQRRNAARQNQIHSAHSETSVPAEVKSTLVQKMWTENELVSNPECELLQCILEEPETTFWVSQQISPEVLENQDLASLLQLCFDLYEQDQLPTVNRLMATVEDTPSKNFIGLIDELSRKLDISSRIRESSIEIEGETVSRFLHQAVRLIKRRLQERDALSEIKKQMVSLTAETSVGSTLDVTAIELLQKAANFHRQRATDNT
ncbi:DNA primase [Polystyrenella longa]|uniref:DNA primase n=1 Tax=Polystyrenella longa TaxID=2528007 RepID=A0A518CPH8_9PLAN|nr:DNA primase [Polystyrenella longa]QDU81130.1 DNA primase [Polystyrenella longa]